MSTYLNNIYPGNIENKKIFCAYHETEFLTNFCQQKQCLMPLCPSCIAQHTQEHFQEGKKPSYININEAISKAKQSCYCTIITLQQYKKLNQDIFKYISALEQNIHIQIQARKKELFQLISSIFSEFQLRLVKQINDDYTQKGVYLIDESINADKYIDDQISNLYEKISLLKGQECLSSLIAYYALDEQNYKEALQQFDEYFQKNRKAGKIQISIVGQKLKVITENLCDNMLSVQSIIQNLQQKPEQPQQNEELKSKRYKFNKGTSQSKVIRRMGALDKQNQQNNRYSPILHKNSLQTNNYQKFNLMKNQEKQISFNAENHQQMIQSKNRLESLESSLKRRAIRTTPNQDAMDERQKFQSKRLIRRFKKQP